jgi:hypothetical protein
MIAAILGLLGVSGVAGLALHLFGWAGTLSKLASFGRGAKDVAARIPPKVKLAIAAVLLLAVLFFVARHFYHKAIDKAYHSGVTAERQRTAAELAKAHQAALQRRDRAEQAATTISKEVRTRYDQEARSIAAGADALRVRGPGAARCGPVDRAGVPAGSGGRQSPGRGSDDPLAAMPPGEGLAAVPWAELVDRAERGDLNRSEVLAWRDWYDRQVKAWERFRAEGAKEGANNGR